MSLDYPNREDWLAVRHARNFPRPVRYRHLSMTGTYSIGQRARKQAIWDAKQARKAARRAQRSAA